MDKLQKALLRADKDVGRRRPSPAPPPAPEPSAEPQRAEPREVPKPEPSAVKGLPRRGAFSAPPLGEAAEAFRVLRAQVLGRAAGVGARSLLIASARPGEGKTFIASRLAAGIAEEGRRACVLIDANVRSPGVARQFGLEPDLGLADYLLGAAELDDILIRSETSHLFLIPGGRPVPNAPDLLEAPRMNALLAALGERWPEALLIFDGPSLAAGADAVLLSVLAGAVLLVVEAEVTPEADLMAAAETLGQRPLLGIAWNQSRG